MLAYPDAQALDVVGPLEVFSRTTRWLAENRGRNQPAYSTEVIAAEAGPLRTSQGLEVIATRSWREVEACDLLMVCGGVGSRAALRDEALLDWLRTMSGRVHRLASVCTGSLILAAAGLLEGRRATTHWASCDLLAELAPGCTVEPDAIYVEDGALFTSAGVTAGMDLALELVERDWGKAVAIAVAQHLVIYRKRPGGQAQFSRFLEAERREDRLGALQLWILEHIGEELPLERMAAEAGMSPRHLTRRFRAELGASPAAYVGRVRLEEARRRLESGAASLKDVARQCGLGDEQNLRRAFRRRMGVAPSDYRERFGG
jgi:transcriptional regulator GlxA family with amidase domain